MLTHPAREQADGGTPISERKARRQREAKAAKEAAKAEEQRRPWVRTVNVAARSTAEEEFTWENSGPNWSKRGAALKFTLAVEGGHGGCDISFSVLERETGGLPSMTGQPL